MTQFSAKAGIPYAELTDAPNMQTYAQGLSATLDNQVTAKYNTVTDRNTANPSPSAGDVCYCADTDIVYFFSSIASNWVSLLPKTIYKTADTTRTSNVTNSDDPHLQVSLEASSKYYFSLALIWNVASSGGGGLRVNFSLPSGAQIGYTGLGPSTTASAFNGADSTLNFSSHPLAASPSSNIYGTNLPNVGNGYPQFSEGIITTTTAGTFTFQWAQNVSSGNGTTVNIGSSLTIQKFG